MESTPMMECGHAANATKENDKLPCCAICWPDPKSITKVKDGQEPDLTGRMARCTYAPKGGPRHKCAGEVPSKKSLAFFGHNPNAETDSFYCGCWGWD
jgi:hypothetical protein